MMARPRPARTWAKAKGKHADHKKPALEIRQQRFALGVKHRERMQAGLFVRAFATAFSIA
jgi:hypothetical protein